MLSNTNPDNSFWQMAPRGYPLVELGEIVEIVKSGPPALQLRAWEVLANRGFGLPKQELDVTSDGEKVVIPVVYAQSPSQTPEEWEARNAPKRKNEIEH